MEPFEEACIDRLGDTFTYQVLGSGTNAYSRVIDRTPTKSEEPAEIPEDIEALLQRLEMKKTQALKKNNQ